MKVLHVETGQHLYGGAKQVYFLINGLAKRGVENILCCPRNAEIGRAVESLGEKVVYTDSAGDLDFRFYRQLKRQIEATRPDLIHLHSRRGADVLGALAVKKSGLPCILSRRVDNPEARFIAKIKYRLYDHIITISNKIREVLVSEGVPAQKITCVMSAVDASKYQYPKPKSEFVNRFQLSDSTITIGVIAQLIHRKGHRHLFNCLPSIVMNYPNIKILVFGRGPEEATLRKMVSDLQLTNQISFAGFHNNIENWLGNLDIVAHPADMEGLGVALLQSAAAGVPIVAANAGGISEVVQDKKNGLLFPPGDVEKLAECLVELIKSPDLRKRYGSEGKKIVESCFSVDTMVEGNLNVYKRVLNNK